MEPKPHQPSIIPIQSKTAHQKEQDCELYHNTDGLCHLIGGANESQVFIDDVECTALINSWVQISTIAISFAKCLGLEIKKLQRFISVEGTGEERFLILGI